MPVCHIFMSASTMLSRIHRVQLSRLIPQWLRHQSSQSTQQVEKINENDFDELTLTKQEVLSYLEKILQMQDPFTFAQQHKYECLCEVQRRTKFIQPFSTLTFLPKETTLHCPTKEKIKEAMFKKRGGGCLQINSFTGAVLRQLGYQAYTIGATLPKERANVYEAHAGLLVKDVTKKGSVHLVEPGTRHPILGPISLDFQRASPEYQLKGYPVKFFRDSPSIVKLCMPISKTTDVRRDANLYFEDGKPWRGMITYRTLQSQNWEYSSNMADVLIKNAKLIPDIHKEIIIFGYSNGIWTIIKGKTFVQYDDNDKEIFKRFKTNEEVVENAHRCFPQYSKEILLDGIAYTEKASKLLEC